jgi:hypothetical protein
MKQILSRGVLSLSICIAPAVHAGFFDMIPGANDIGKNLIKSAIDSGGGNRGTTDSTPQGLSVNLVGTESLPKNKKVILGNFVVEFQNRYEKTSQGLSFMGMGNAGSSTAINDVTLPSSQTLQTITNFAYLDVVKKLKAHGYEVIEVSDLLPEAKTAYQEMAKSAYAVMPGATIQNHDGQSILYSPEGMSTTIPDTGCDHYKGALGNLIAFNTRTASYENKIAIAQGGIPMLKVWMTVGFGDADAKGGNSNENILKRQSTFGTNKSAIESGNNAKATAGMYLKPGATRFAFLAPAEHKFEYTTPNCSSGWKNKNSYRDPADGDAILLLGNKYHDDGSEVVALSSKANSIGVTDTALGGGIGIRSVKENTDGTQAQSVKSGQGAKLSLKGSSSSGRIVGNTEVGTRIDTTTQYATEISADFYASTAIKIIDDVSAAFVNKLP